MSDIKEIMARAIEAHGKSPAQSGNITLTDLYEFEAQAAIDALEQAGYVIVPKVMTPEIYAALETRYPWAVIPPGQVQEDWAAMLEASASDTPADITKE